MADASTIEWTDATWQPITGCSIVSPGCANCYAMRLAGTRLRHHPSREGLTIDSKAGPVWNGQVRFNEQWLTQPLQWKRPRMIFVCAHGDLFHESVPDEWIDRVFAVMALAPQHTFQVLTKRAERMRQYLAGLGYSPNGAPRRSLRIEDVAREVSGNRTLSIVWPLPNVWPGISAERQPEWDARIAHLKATPAALRWVSAEPLLDGIVGNMGGIDWLVCGGESGPGARPMHPDWARSLRDQCAAAGVPFFFKQWGNWTPGENVERQRGIVATATWFDGRWLFGSESLANCEGHIDDEPDLYDVGKKAAGRLLDGVEHNGRP